ncbi:Glycosyl transferases group 1 [Butyrivibrio sp. ob235]|uniref:glycosyltransferase family 4 protein n=1 Tax=Butyrivibrio sp. ob235 TaxID=1761780 RepID=UPI0008AF8BB8|nr:glycosyltransferase [Butyrivibrio sp. ob235]SEK82601.1 Glycosyl transferases group 1 [Butyrivibrio sp. ob235]
MVGIKIAFISNFINHHQIPLCDEMYSRIGDGFSFIETQPMEEGRRNLGWNSDTDSIPYVHRIYEDEAACAVLIKNCDVLMLGWTGQDKASLTERLIKERLDSGKPVIRVSERIYREGRWKAISPRGLKAKYEEHIKYKNSQVYMLCAGAYVSGDFSLIGAYPGKMYKWGYYPPLRQYTDEELDEMLYKDGDQLRICLASRLIKLKHPEFAITAAEILREKGLDFHIDVVGDGPLAIALSKEIRQKELLTNITLHGAVNPDKVRDIMEKSHVFIFGSNYLEGWGAVVNEAMNSACAVIASSEAGAVPYLIEDGVNGLTFDNCDENELRKKLTDFINLSTEEKRALQKNAYKTIETTWNAKCAAERLLSFCKSITGGTNYNMPKDGPMSIAKVLKAPGFIRTLKEDNHLE